MGDDFPGDVKCASMVVTWTNGEEITFDVKADKTITAQDRAEEKERTMKEMAAKIIDAKDQHRITYDGVY